MLFYASKDCHLELFEPKVDALERRCMQVSDFIEKYHWRKDIMELLIKKAWQIIKE